MGSLTSVRSSITALSGLADGFTAVAGRIALADASGFAAGSYFKAGSLFSSSFF